MLCGIPQGSVFGAIIFLIYSGDLQRLIQEHGLRPHLHVDDSQIYGSCRPSMYPEMQTRISACIDDVAEWMLSNRLQLNSANTEILWCASSRRLHQLPTTALRFGSDHAAPSVVVRDLAFFSTPTCQWSRMWCEQYQLASSCCGSCVPSVVQCRDPYYSHWWCH